MDLITGLPIWAQAQPGTANPNAISLLALRRWCGSLTLSSPRPAPDLHGLLALLAGLAVLFAVAMIAQGPARAFGQLFEIPAHIRLVRDGLRRLRRSSRMVAALIGFTVVSWTGSQSLAFFRDMGREEMAQTGRGDLLQLTRSRGPGELAAEQGVLAALTPLRDVAGLADNLPLLIVAAILVFRASIEPQRSGDPGASAPGSGRGRAHPVWTTVAWGVGALYILYRVVARAAGSPDLPFGNCLVIETILIPMAMAVVDGLLLAWVLTEIRNAGLDADQEPIAPLQAVALLPAAILAALAILPARYVAALVVLTTDHLPTSIQTTTLGGYIRWQLGGWGLCDLQAAAIVMLGIVGVVAWTRGRMDAAIVGYGRLLVAEGGHLVVALAMAGVAAGLGSAVAYAVVLLLPSQSWVLNAADSYAHFLTLPVGLWTLAALVELAQRSLPVASPARAAHAADANGESGRQHPSLHDAHPPVAAPAT